MENYVLQRVKEIMDRYNLSVTALSKKINVAQTTLNRQIQGDGVVSLATICSILDCFKDVSAEWLLRGEGAMIQGESTSNDFPKTFDAKIEIGSDGCLKIKIKE